MFTTKPTTRLLGITAALLLATNAPEVLAVASNITVNNSATVTYEVNSVAQDPENAAISFVTDKIANFSMALTNGAAVAVVPSQTTAALGFSVQNTGNDPQDFLLSAVEVATSGPTNWGGATDDAFDADSGTAIKFYKDVNTNGTYESGTDTLLTGDYIDELAAGSTQQVLLVATIDSAVTNGQYASLYLTANIAVGGAAASAGAALFSGDDGDAAPDDKDAVEVVFNDGAGDNSDVVRNGKFTVHHDFLVASASLTITKSSTIVSDGINASNFKRIPGAVIEYTVTINNTGGAVAASAIKIVDDLNTEIATNGTLAFTSNVYDSATKEIKITNDALGTPAYVYYTEEEDGDIGEFDGTGTANQVIVDGLSVPAGEEMRIQFQVTIQ